MDNDLIWNTFRCEVWGPSPERARGLAELETVILHRPAANILIRQFKEAREEGSQAFRLSQDLSLMLRDNREKSTREWLIRWTAHCLLALASTSTGRLRNRVHTTEE